jgi:hypothetical protein
LSVSSKASRTVKSKMPIVGSSGGIASTMVLPFKQPSLMSVAARGSLEMTTHHEPQKMSELQPHLPQSLRTLTPHPASVSTYSFCSDMGNACRKYSLLSAKDMEDCLRAADQQSATVAARPIKRIVRFFERYILRERDA